MIKVQRQELPLLLFVEDIYLLEPFRVACSQKKFFLIGSAHLQLVMISGFIP